MRLFFVQAERREVSAAFLQAGVGPGSEKTEFDGEVVSVPNEKNIVPYQFTGAQSREEAAKNGKKGGIASGAARRRKRRLKEAADLYLSLPVTDRRRAKKLERRSIDPEDIDNQMAMIAGLWEAACEGSAQAATVLIKLLGEDTPGQAPVPEESSLLDALVQATEEDMDTDDLPEVE